MDDNRSNSERKTKASLSEGLMIEEYLNQKVVIDLHSPYVCLGTLNRFDEGFLKSSMQIFMTYATPKLREKTT